MRLLRPWPRHSGAIRICSAQRTVGAGGSFREPRLDHCVESPVGKTRSVSVPRGGDRVPDADDLLALVVPGVEQELRVLGDHAPEEPLQDGVVVHELGPGSRKTVRVREFAGPLCARGKWSVMSRRSVARPNWICHQRVRTSKTHRQQLDRVLRIRWIKIQLRHWHETHREVEGARLSVFRPRVGSVGEGFHQHESIAVGSELVAQRRDQRSDDAPSTIASMDRQP